MLCSSRFAVLKVEDDDYLSDAADNEQPTLKPKAQAINSNSKNQNKNKAKKKKKLAANPELQKLAFGASQLPKTKAVNTKNNNKPKPENPDQWDNFVKRDEVFVKDTYENDLHEALIQSQMEYEKKSQETPTEPKKKKKNSKKNMSLGDFQNLSVESPPNSSPIIAGEEDYFNNIDKACDDIISKETRAKSSRSIKFDQPTEADHIKTVEVRNKLELADSERIELRKEVEALKKDLEKAQAKKKEVIKILCDSETKEKVDLILQVNNLTMIRDDLNEQIVSLHASLEQERSKVHTLQTELNKYQNKKKVEGRK